MDRENMVFGANLKFSGFSIVFVPFSRLTIDKIF